MRSLQQWSYALFSTILCVALSQYALAQCESNSCNLSPEQVNTTAGIVPLCVAGGPDCCQLAGRPGFRMSGNINGTFFLTNKYGELTTCNGVTNPVDSVNTFSVQYNPSAKTFSWTASSGLVIEQIIVKGNQNASTVYNYANTAVRHSDGNLHAPVNAANCMFHPVSSIEICYRYQLSVVHTIKPTYTRTFSWNITQSVTPDNWSLFAGDRGTARYTVALDQTGFTDGAWAAAGTIEIKNNTPLPAQIIALTDTIRPGTIPAGVISCGNTAFTLPPGAALTCSFTAPMPDATARTATLNVVTLGAVRGRTIATPFQFGSPSTQVGAAINVTDTNGQNRGSISKDSTYTYERSLTCSNQGVYTNTATIVETGQKAAATVNIQCVSPSVSTTVNTTFERVWNWEITLDSKQKDITLAPGQRYLTQYDAVANAVPSDVFQVTGTITVKNPHPTRNINLTNVSNILTGNIAAAVTCPANSIAPGGTLVCTYTALAPDNTPRVATATVNQQNYSYPISGNPMASGGTRTSATGSALFSIAPNAETDECAYLYDDSIGTKNTISTRCAADLPYKFTVKRYIGPFANPAQCDTQPATLIVEYQTLDLKKSGKASHEIAVVVPCKTGCTLPQAYWIAHAPEGTAAFDANWNDLPDADGDGQAEGGAETFFLAGKTWLQTLNTAPGTNPYWHLAKAYVTSELNRANGADTTIIKSAHAAALTLLQIFSPAQVPLQPNSIKKQFTLLAAMLERYNTGTIGPGSCSIEPADTDEDDQIYQDAGDRSKPAENAAVSDSEDFFLYPNPASTQVMLNFKSDLVSTARLSVYNAQGGLVLSQKINAGQTLIPLSAPNFSAGFYVFVLHREQGNTLAQKILVTAE